MLRYVMVFLRRWSRSFTARGASLVFVTRVLGAGLNLIIHVLLARWAGPTVYGTYSYAIAWVSTLSIVTGLGFPEASLRFIPTYLQTENWKPLHGIAQRGERLTLLVSVGVSLVVTAGIWGLPIPSGPTTQAILIAFWALPLSALVRYYTEACRAVDQIAAAYAAPRLLRPGIIIAGILTLTTIPGSNLSGPSLTSLFGIAFLPVLTVQRYSFHACLAKKSPSGLSPQFDTNRWLRVAFPLLLVSGFTILLRQVDLLLVGWMLDMRATGIYQAAVTVASPAGFAISAINAVAAPRFARLYAENDQASLQRLVRTLSHWLFWPTLAFSLFIAVGSPVFLELFGSEFDTARLPLFLLILSQLFNAGSGSVEHLLNMTGHHTDSARVYGITTLLHLGTSVASIYFFGLIGAAATTALSSLLWNAWLHLIVQKQLRLSPSILSTLYSSK